ncbi:hypothetical protein QEV83_06875 [Methylocapsa sp. D3K7]|uniref:hypothetical protein n=1 Tax=Methylocapsa sp. D3K7 TaxID=3041435 RepID=UPI00244E61EF|nr:hypothetical protein [Methylocapsa sp. D3K7]WGJ15966.1 hypothetical protein QEV83_06875 [Methylocapsa sp. D3K7]
MRTAAASFCRPMSRHRFNLYAIGTRRSKLYRIFDEVSWWSSPDERIIASAGRDLIDSDYSWAMLVRDAIGRFRAAKVDCSYPSLSAAEKALWKVMNDTQQTEDLVELGKQGDETNAPTDLLRLPTDFDPAQLHPYFRVLLEDRSRAPARAVIKEIGPWLTPNDPHMVEEFQRKAFDQRLWEIYLWAALREFGLDVEQLEAPDFRCRGPGVDFTVEATTAAPSTMGPLAEHPDPKTQEEIRAFLYDYMPMKYGSALSSKLRRTNKDGLHYWEREESKNKPFLLAIADFHKPADSDKLGSMTYTQSALWQYLYGQRVHWTFEDGKLVVNARKIEDHRYGEKVVPSGFFDDPLAANISAVLFSNAGTLSKFDRMGIVAGFAVPGDSYYRIGMKVDPDPNAAIGIPFSADVTAPNNEEFWTEEIQVFHNPNAKYPLPFEVLLGATHHFIKEGRLRSWGPMGSILTSYSMIFRPRFDGDAEAPEI